MPELSTPVLAVKGLVSGYGKKEVLHGIDLSISSAERVALIGHNAAGKSTILKALFGILPVWAGTVALDGVPIERLNPRNLLRVGITYVGQGYKVFPELTVDENLRLGPVAISDNTRIQQRLDYVLGLFPELRDDLRRQAGDLSGGQRHILSLATAFMTSPRLLLLDEPSLGLALPLVRRMLQHIRDISENTGTACLIVEQKVREVLDIVHRVYVLKSGSISFSGPSLDLKDESALRQAFL